MVPGDNKTGQKTAHKEPFPHTCNQAERISPPETSTKVVETMGDAAYNKEQVEDTKN